MRKRRSGANQRKRFAEKRQPPAARPTRHWPWGWALALGAGLTAAAFFAPRIHAWIMTSPLFIVKTIRVRGPANVDTSAVIAAAGVHPGMRLSDVHPRRIRQRLAGFRWARRIHVARKLPNAVEIFFEKRQPLALLSLGRVCYVDREGVVFTEMPDAPDNLPLAFGLTDTVTCRQGIMRLSQTDLKSLRTFLNVLRASGGGLSGQATQIDLSNLREARFTCNSGRTMVILDRDTAPQGLVHLKRLFELLGATPAEMPRHIDLRRGNLAFVR